MDPRRPWPIIRVVTRLAVPAAILCFAFYASAEEPKTGGDTSEQATPATPTVLPGTVPTTPKLGLDRLLRPRTRLPSFPKVDTTGPGGKSREVWERDFAERRREVAELEANVEGTKANLRENSSTDWGYSPAGASLPTDPEVMKLRAQLKRDRKSLEAARRRLRDLQVEASLAGVPDPWQSPAPVEPTP